VKATASSQVRQAVYRRIADDLKNKILVHELAPGEKLPSKADLMKTWRVSSFTIHAAVQVLIKEGWVESIRGTGAYVANRKERFSCAGIYHGADICSEKETPFARRVHIALLEKFRALNKNTLVFVDTRPEAEQKTLLPNLAEAILHRRIQCLVYPFASQFNLPVLNQLRIPMATLSSQSPVTLNYDVESLFQGSMQQLAAAGCRSVGLLGGRFADVEDERRYPFYATFRKAAKDAGLTAKDEWISAPTHFLQVQEIERHGYEEFHWLWKRPDRPDGLMVFPDTMAKGAILAILECGLANVSEKMKFLFHRNAHLDYLCPFPAMWAISDEDALAAELVAQIQKQFEGQRLSSVQIPYSFKSDYPAS
jgi:DNA-binding LacI/PurR family transcriptional regulator